MSHHGNDYPEHICVDCGIEYGRHAPRPDQVGTLHDDVCGICGRFKPCAETRDFGHLGDGWREAQHYWDLRRED